MSSDKCPRCYPGMDAASKDTVQHAIGRCTRDAVYQQHQNKFVQTWPAVKHEGAKSDNPGDLQQSDALLKNFTSMTSHNGKPITKWMLENAWKVVFPTRSGANAAEAEVAKKQSAPSTSGTSGQASKELPVRANMQNKTGLQGAAGQSTSHQPSGSYRQPAGSSKASAATTPTASNTKQTFIESDPPTRTPRAPAPEYEYAVHKDCALDDSLASTALDQSRSGSGHHFIVAANYVAVSGTPQKVYMYGIEYGTITAVRSEQQVKEDEQAAQSEASAKNSKSATDSIAGGSEGQGRKVGQRSEKARIFKTLESRSPLNNTPWATDYEHLWTLKPIPENELTILRVMYAKLSGRNYRLDTIDFKHIRDLTLSGTPALATKSLLNQDEVTKKGGSLRITALNALITRHVSSGNDDIIQVGPNKFFLKSGFVPATGLFDIHRGYYTSIRPGADSILLNVNTATAAFYKPMSVAEFYNLFKDRRFRDYGDPEDMLKGLTVRIAYNRQKHDDAYDPDIELHRHRTIAGFGDVPSKEEFDHNGTTKTVAQYFAELGATISKPGLPCVSINVAPKKTTSRIDEIRDKAEQGSKKPGAGKDGKKDKKDDKVAVKPNWVPPEFLQIDPYQAFNKLLQSVHTDDMLKVALRHPAKNQDLIINEAFPLLGIGQQGAGFNHLQLTIGDKLIAVPARELPAPSIMYRTRNQQQGQGGRGRGGRDGQRGGRGQPAGGFQQGGRQAEAAQNQVGRPIPANVLQASWNVMNVHFFQPPSTVIGKAVCTIDMRMSRHDGDLTQIGLQLSKTMQDHGMRFTEGVDLESTHGYQDTYSHLKSLGSWDDVSLDEVLQKDIAALGSPNMLLILLSEKDSPTYGALKRVCDQWQGVHTVCLVVDKLYKFDKLLKENIYTGPQGPLLSNLALKFNMKLRGQNHQICLPVNQNQSAFHAIASDTIVLGADVSHPSGGMAYCPSVAAVVGSDDPNFANFPGAMRLQAGTQEMIEELDDMVYECLIRFHKLRNALPKRMIFYRDGVSEDQFAKCRSMEIPQIMNAFERAKDEVTPKERDSTLTLTFIVVGKRHHTRFFTTKESQTYRDDFRNGHNTHIPRQEPKKHPRGYTLTDKDKQPIIEEVKLNGNLRPGLIVDQVITRPPVDETFDFFLQSHAALKGTARSAHYTVLRRGTFTVAHIQTLTHAFCYNYMRATKGVSYAGPAYYADRLCDRGNHYLRGYTAGQKTPEIQMSAYEQGMENKKEAAMVFAKRVAQDISQKVVWNPRINDPEHPGRKNPWDPKFDECMFWL
ncbi:hypothetical protein LTR85_001452 [Meristemomyces frigidus]|nr:hypothetical protein LTR85_001452 [Meristemomyces frigidus]